MEDQGTICCMQCVDLLNASNYTAINFIKLNARVVCAAYIEDFHLVKLFCARTYVF